MSDTLIICLAMILSVVTVIESLIFWGILDMFKPEVRQWVSSHSQRPRDSRPESPGDSYVTRYRGGQ